MNTYFTLSSTANGERTLTRGPCRCGYKHWVDGKEYDFVFKWATSSGPRHLGVNVNDNFYNLAEQFVLKYETNTLSLNSKDLVNSIADTVTKYISQYTSINIDNRPAIPQDYGNFEFEDTPMILTEKDIEDIMKREELSKQQKEKVEEELRQEKKSKEDIKAMMLKDREEVEASKKLLTPQKPTSARSGFISVVGEDGNVKLVEKPKGPRNTEEKGYRSLHDLNKVSENDDQHDSEDEDEEDIWERYYGRPPKQAWSLPMLVHQLQKQGYLKTQRLMQECGFTPTETIKYLAIAQDRIGEHETTPEKDNKSSAFSGTGHKLVSTTAALTINSSPSTTTEAYRITVDPALPQTLIKVRLFNGNMTTINVNHETTVQQLAEHIKSLSSLPPGAQFNMKDQGSFPPRILSQLDQTIKQANLLNGSVIQSLV